MTIGSKQRPLNGAIKASPLRNVRCNVYALLERGVAISQYSHPLFFAGEQFNICTLSWHTSVCTEAALFSSYMVLKVGGVIQYDPDE